MEKVTRTAAVIVGNSKLLMVVNNDYGDLWFPGGKIEQGESEEECLKRELKEELDLKVEVSKFFGSFSGESPYHDHITRNKVYIVEVEGVPTPRNEIDSFLWLSRQEFEEKEYPMIEINKEEIIPALIEEGMF